MKSGNRREQLLRVVGLGVALTVFAGPTWAQAMSGTQARVVRYKVIDLTPSAAFSEAFYVDDDGLVSGTVSVPDGTQHAFLWYKGILTDIGTPGLVALPSNSAAFTVNHAGEATGGVENGVQDPNGENFCSFGTGLECRAFVWQNGTMKALPLPESGGNNGSGVSINSLGQVAGVAETNTVDGGCPPPQVFDYEAAIWAPGSGEIEELPPLPGDSVGEALWINDKGQAVGSTGSCASTTLPPLAVAPHAVLWENGSPVDLGNLGGACVTLCFSELLGLYGNTALYITNSSNVVGVSTLAGEKTFHAFLWTKQTGKMQDLGTLPGHLASIGLGLNEAGEVVGGSFDPTGTPHAFLRQNGVMNDLNDLSLADSPFQLLLVAQFINASGEIAGLGLTSDFEVHGFLATPINSDVTAPATSSHANIVLPDSMRNQIRQQLRFRGVGTRPIVH